MQPYHFDRVSSKILHKNPWAKQSEQAHYHLTRSLFSKRLTEKIIILIIHWSTSIPITELPHHESLSIATIKVSRHPIHCQTRQWVPSMVPCIPFQQWVKVWYHACILFHNESKYGTMHSLPTMSSKYATMHSLPASKISFMIQARIDHPPLPINLCRWQIQSDPKHLSTLQHLTFHWPTYPYPLVPPTWRSTLTLPGLRASDNPQLTEYLPGSSCIMLTM